MASEALRGFGQRRGGRGCSSPRAKEKATPWDGKRAQTASRIFDVTLSSKVNVMYWNEGCTTQWGASRGYWGLIGFPSSRTSPTIGQGSASRKYWGVAAMPKGIAAMMQQREHCGNALQYCRNTYCGNAEGHCKQHQHCGNTSIETGIAAIR